jgi:serine/threonine-protein kinase RsbW
MVLPAVPSSARTARRFVDDALAHFGVGDGALTETAVLLTSELVTNAVLYTAGTIELAVHRLDDAVKVSVGDSSAMAPEPHRPGPQDASGRGLGLVEALSEAWGVDPPPGGDREDAGKAVWFTLRVG